MKPTIEELEKIEAERVAERKRRDKAIDLWICPDCEKDLTFKKGLWPIRESKYVCACGFNSIYRYRVLIII